MQGVPAQRRWSTVTRRTRLVVGAGIAVVVLAGGAWYAVTSGENGSEATGSSDVPTETAVVTKQDLAETEEVDGTLGYGTERQVVGSGKDIITWLPAEGVTIARGQPVYKVDDDPIPLLYGSLPLYRPLQVGVSNGPDVRQLEQNLKALGYDDLTVDEHYTEWTADAVSAWQADRELPESGRIDLGDVVIASGAIRIGALSGTVGAGGGGPVLSYTGTTQSVSVPLEVTDESLAKKGGKVTVTMPNGDRVDGTITEIGAVAHAVESDEPTSDSGSTATIDLTVALDNPKDAAGLDQAPVDVELVSAERKNVLTVPVSALLALSEGGYGVEVVEGNSSKIVAVETGMFANGNVEVSGGGLKVGTKVGVPEA